MFFDRVTVLNRLIFDKVPYSKKVWRNSAFETLAKKTLAAYLHILVHDSYALRKLLKFLSSKLLIGEPVQYCEIKLPQLDFPDQVLLAYAIKRDKQIQLTPYASA